MKRKCCICGGTFHAAFGGLDYCSRHYNQMWRNGRISERTIYDRNQCVIEGDITTVFTYNKKGEQNGEFIIDTEDWERISNIKWYSSVRQSKLYIYGSISADNKIALHRYILNTKNIVDHINGNTLDNRKCNLREIDPASNSYNKLPINKHFYGITKCLYYAEKPYTAFISKNGKEKCLGRYKHYVDAAFARLKAEQEYFGEYGSHRDLYYILSHPSPIEELNKVLKKECNRIG